MAATVNSTAKTTAQPSAPMRAIKIDVSLDDSYPSGGYDISGDIAESIPFDGPFCPIQDGSTKRFARVTSAGKLEVHEDNTSLAETSAMTDLSNYTNQDVYVFVQ